MLKRLTRRLSTSFFSKLSDKKKLKTFTRSPKKATFVPLPVPDQGKMISSKRALMFLLAHIPLAVIFNFAGFLATIHALSVLLVGIYFIRNDRKPDRVVYVLAYIMGAELLWRGLKAKLFYEYGKYAIIVLIALTLVRYGYLSRIYKPGLVYLIALCPAFMVLPYFNREEIAFNLSGPFALGFGMMFFPLFTINKNNIEKIIIAGLAPVVGLAAHAVTYYHIGGHNRKVTGGIGANQVSSILGLGITLAFFLLLNMQRGKLYRLIILILLLWLVGQTILSYSRGGLWNALGAILVCCFFIFRNNKYRAKIIGYSLIFFVAIKFIVFPMVETSSGRYGSRFKSFDLTDRDSMMEADLIIFSQNPLLGVGPGQAFYLYTMTYRESDSHTEYTRLLSEHGIFGIIALLTLFGSSFRKYLASGRSFEKAFSLSFMFWTYLYMIHAAMRLVAPSMMFSLALSKFDLS